MTDEKPRTLTDEESLQLRSHLSTCLLNKKDGSSTTGTSEEDANDLLDYALAMVVNGKSVDYIVNDLKNMGMDHICDENASVEIGKKIHEFFDGERSVTDKVSHGTATTTDTNVTSSKRVIILKSKTTENALTMSGALGSSKKKEKKENKKGNALTMSGALGTSREGGGSNNNDQHQKKEKKNDHKQKNLGKNGKTNRNIRVGGGGKSIASEAFQKLTQHRDNDKNKSQKRNHNNNMQNNVSGRGGRGRGRDEQRNNGRGGQRDAGSGRRTGGRFDNGRERNTDDSRKFAAQKRIHEEIQQFRGEQEFGGGLGRGFERGRGSEESNKRSRHDSNSAVIETSNKPFQNEWHASGGRGHGRGRGGGRAGGRGRGRDNNNHNESSTLAAAEVSPSPLVAAEFGTKLSYSGRGNFQRGGGRGFRGRGRCFPGRSHVAAMLAAKTWTRSKANDGDDNYNNKETGAA